MQMHMSVDNLTVEQCKAMKLFSPEKVLTLGGGSCCINNPGAFKDNTRAQGRKGNYKKTMKACCDGFDKKTGGVDALKSIGCRFNKKEEEDEVMTPEVMTPPN